jgi:SAM-dependent methyltransferase
VLDLACGTGNVTAELLRRGYQVEGADSSRAMLAVARRKLGSAVRLHRQDARNLRLPGPPFDACVCLFDSLNYLLDARDLRRAFAAVARHLQPGGTFVFDVNAIRALRTGMFDQTGTGRDPSLEYEWHSAWDPAARLCTIEMEFRVRDRQGMRLFHETHVQRGYALEEIETALRAAQLAVLGVFDAFTTRPPTEVSDRYHFIAAAKHREVAARG